MEPEEEAKIRLEHRLGLWRIVVEKVLIGLAIIAAGYWGNSILENLRAQAAEDQFFLKERLQAIENVSEAYGRAHAVFDIYSPSPGKYKDSTWLDSMFLSRIGSYRNEYSPKKALFLDTLNRTFQRYMWLLQGVSHHGVDQAIAWQLDDSLKLYRRFMHDAKIQFYSYCKAGLYDSLGLVDTRVTMVAADFAEADLLGAERYFDSCFVLWCQE